VLSTVSGTHTSASTFYDNQTVLTPYKLDTFFKTV
jgi:hypothetical protein